MTWDYQNLQEDDGRPHRHWSNGRVWFRRAGNWYDRRAGTLRVEWTAGPHAHCGWGLTLGGGDSGSDIGCNASIPFLLAVYVTLERVLPLYWFGTDFNRGHDRNIGCYFYAWAFWYQMWVGSMASWSRDYPWCKPWRQGSFHFANLLGKQQYTTETIESGIPLAIPMPEGLYHGTAKLERQRWKRRLWFPRVRESLWAEMPKGIPFAGKGENSWDCGNDGLFGIGSEGRSVEKLIGHIVESVLDSRRRYGMPSEKAIQEALG